MVDIRCVRCGSTFSVAEQTLVEEPARAAGSRTTVVVWGIVIVVLAGVFGGLAWRNHRRDEQRTERESTALSGALSGQDDSDGSFDAPVTEDAGGTVDYCWSGTASSVNLTLTNAQGGTEQASHRANNQCISRGWFVAGSFTYLAVQNESGSGSISCSIKIDGVEEYTSNSEGGYVIASCSGRVP